MGINAEYMGSALTNANLSATLLDSRYWKLSVTSL